MLLSDAHALATPDVVDADTRAWWSIIGDLSGDDMEGRDTGSAAYARAVHYVAAKFKAAALQPAGDGGGFTQTLPLHEVSVEKTGTSFTVIRAGGGETALVFLHQISVRATQALPPVLDAPLSFRGYCSHTEIGEDMKGKVAVCFGGRGHGVPGAAERIAGIGVVEGA